MTEKPTIILVPGGWHAPAQYAPLTTVLESAGYLVHTIHLPSTIGYPSNPTHNPDVDLIASTINKAADNGEDILLVMHSSGGACGGEAARGLSKAERQGQGKTGGIVRCLYITAFAAAEGMSVFKATNGPSPWVQIEGEVSRPGEPERILFNDLSPKQQQEAINKLTLHSCGAMWSEVTYAPWKHIPSTYLVCENDNAIPLEAQEGMIAQPGNMFDMVERCSTGHCPYLAVPQFTAEVIRRAAGENISSNL